MLTTLNVHPTVPAHDMERARRFYAQKLGFTPSQESPGGLMYESGDTFFVLYPSQGAGTAEHTLMGWVVDDLEAEVADLKARGVVFEEYDSPGLRTVNSIATIGADRGAWFKDTEGNILGLVEFG